MRCHKCNENRSTFEELFAHLSGCRGFVPTESAQPKAEAEPLPFEPTPEELQAASSYELNHDDQEILNRVTTQLKKAVSEDEAHHSRQTPNA